MFASSFVKVAPLQLTDLVVLLGWQIGSLHGLAKDFSFGMVIQLLIECLIPELPVSKLLELLSCQRT